ncbi:MAG: GNAT family N-acetyltransferase [Actinomycetota bacterium]|nr:GNAT family N-acetyltransferase [Actinomycetota bacterium]
MSGSPADGTDVVVRLAGPADAAEITRLRAVMLASVDGGPLRLDEEWADLCRSELASRLAAGTVLVAMVVDAPDGSGLAAAGIGVIDLRLPAPGRLSTRVGHISSMCTDAQWRRQGYGTAVLDAIVAWLRERGCSRVELAASDDGLPLYQRSGFVESPNPSLRRRLN